MARHRRDLLAGLTGEVIEPGCGNGLNFAHYPSTVTRVLAVEPQPYLRALAEQAAAKAPVPVEVVEGFAEELPAADGSFDAAVTSLMLCSVADLDAAVAELARVLRPGGQVRFLEHVRAETKGLARLQRVLDATVWPPLAGGCHTARDPVAALKRAGFEVEPPRRFRFPETAMTLPTTAHVLGTAEKAH